MNTVFNKLVYVVLLIYPFKHYLVILNHIYMIYILDLFFYLVLKYLLDHDHIHEEVSTLKQNQVSFQMLILFLKLLPKVNFLTFLGMIPSIKSI